jgi:hypothetical protein
MAKTSAEKARTWRAKHKQEESFKEKRKKENKNYNDKKRSAENAVQTAKRQKDARLRKQKSRAAKRLLHAVIDGTPIKKISPSTMGKALKKAARGLPNSPRTRKLVMSRLTEIEGIQILENSPPICRKRTDNHVLEEVAKFYERDDISRVDPGRKSAVVSRRLILPRRHLLYNISEAFGLFRDEFPNLEIRRSKFASLRPAHVKPFREIPHNVCICKYHENFKSIFEAIAKKLPDIGSSYQEFIANNVCDIKNFECMHSKCKDCVHRIDDLVAIEQDSPAETITYRQWKMDTNTKRMEHVPVAETLAAALRELKAQVIPFKLHSFTKDQTQIHFNVLRKDSSPENILLQVDFAENYAAQYQNEIQSAHWGNPQVCVFTGVVWYGDEKASYAIVADNISHDRFCVDVFIRKIIDIYKEKFPTLKTVNIFSDGCAAQFKSRYNFANMTLMKKDYDLAELTWSFFATSHGKGAVDGIGAVVKRHVWNAVRAKDVAVRNAEMFAGLCTELKVSVIYVPSDEIKAAEEKLNVAWQDLIAVKGTQSIHHFAAGEPYQIKWKMYPQQAVPVPVCLRKAIESKDEDDLDDPGEGYDTDNGGDGEVDELTGPFLLGDWVVAIFDDQWLPGLVEEVKRELVRVKFMKVCGPNRFIWPAADDFATLHQQTLLAKLKSPPNLVTSSSRGAIFSVETSEFRRVLDLFINL